jgi:cytochrome c
MKSPSLALVALLALAGSASAQTAAPAPAPATAAAALPPGHAEDGQAIFKKCLACHQIGPTAKNSVGPALNGIIGRKAGTYPGYAYSDANKNSGIVWSEQTLAEYLPSPKDFVPGTKMSFAGLTSPQDVADVIAYLKQYDAQGTKTPMP